MQLSYLPWFLSKVKFPCQVSKTCEDIWWLLTGLRVSKLNAPYASLISIARGAWRGEIYHSNVWTTAKYHIDGLLYHDIFAPTGSGIFLYEFYVCAIVLVAFLNEIVSKPQRYQTTFLWKLRSIHLSAYYVWRALVYFKRALFISI